MFDEPTAAIDAEPRSTSCSSGSRRSPPTGRRSSSRHRFSTVRIADRIAVLHGGRLEELGSHRELVARGGRYAHLFGLQAQGYLD